MEFNTLLLIKIYFNVLCREINKYIIYNTFMWNLRNLQFIDPIKLWAMHILCLGRRLFRFTWTCKYPLSQEQFCFLLDNTFSQNMISFFDPWDSFTNNFASSFINHGLWFIHWPNWWFSDLQLKWMKMNLCPAATHDQLENEFCYYWV